MKHRVEITIEGTGDENLEDAFCFDERPTLDEIEDCLGRTKDLFDRLFGDATLDEQHVWIIPSRDRQPDMVINAAEGAHVHVRDSRD